MKTNAKILFVVITGIIAFTQSTKAVDFSWKHPDTSNTKEYVLYEIVGEQDEITVKGDGDDLPVGKVPVGNLEMKDVRIKPAKGYYVRAENDFFVSGPSNTVLIPDLPTGIIELKVTVNLNLVNE